VIAYDPKTGEELWRCEGLSGDVAPSPVYADGKVFVTNETAYIMAIRTGGRGNVTETHVEWRNDMASMSDASSPVCDGKLFVQAAGSSMVVNCLDAGTGEEHWEQGFDSDFRASPALVGGRVYLTGDDGKTTVIKLSATYERLSEGTVGERVEATPAFHDSQIIIRGEKHLFCIGRKAQ
jgi:outer membrane protein assembly factor BamB